MNGAIRKVRIVDIDLVPHLGVAGLHCEDNLTLEVSIDDLLRPCGPVKGGWISFDESTGAAVAYESPTRRMLG
jgi:hypothetical protein